jgi:N-hydroxyarylamine O-acetyltransferase
MTKSLCQFLVAVLWVAFLPGGLVVLNFPSAAAFSSPRAEERDMNLQSYLERIGFAGKAEPTLACLTEIHRRQAFTIPYDTLDIQLGRPHDRDINRIFDKTVARKRGGWCYETHELLHWALREIGFSARIVTAAIHREQFGDSKRGNHTAILVDLDQTYLADLGLGDGIRDPIPLAEGVYHQGHLAFRLEKTGDGYWRFRNHAFGFPTDFDFKDEPLDEGLIDTFSRAFQSGENPTFTQNLACQIMQPNTVTCLSGRVLRHKTPDGTSKKLVHREEFEDVLLKVFGIADRDTMQAWPRVEARHFELFGDKPFEQVTVTGF